MNENYSLKNGTSYYFERKFSQEEFNRFAKLSKDNNPIHVNPDFSKRTKFGKTVAHGMFLYGNICQALGTLFTNSGFIQLSQELIFPSPTYTEENLKIELHIKKVDPSKKIYEIETIIKLPNGEFGLQGSTTIIPLNSNTRISWKAMDSVQKNTKKFSNSTYKGLKIGQSDKISEIISLKDLKDYIELFKDNNLIYSNLDYLKSIGFSNYLVPGCLLGGVISEQLGTRLPGKGTNWLKFNINFIKPFYIDQELTSIVEVIRIRPEKQLINLKTSCFNSNKDIILNGEALVLISDLKDSKP